MPYCQRMGFSNRNMVSRRLCWEIAVRGIVHGHRKCDLNNILVRAETRLNIEFLLPFLARSSSQPKRRCCRTYQSGLS